MQKAGNFFMFGFKGKRPEADFLDLLRQQHLAGVVLFSENISSPKQVKSLTEELQAAADGKLFIAIDHEGGKVVRTSKPFTHFPAFSVLAKAASAEGDDIVFQAAKAMGEELAACGINYNFAPVLDVSTNVFNPIIGERAFSENQDRVAELGVKFIEGLEAAGVMSCGKHFPGHGDSNEDSHLSLPTLSHTKKRFEVCEFIPFKQAIAAGLPSIMTGHLKVPLLDRDHMMTCSRKVLTKILREEFQFGGLVVSDDLGMKALQSVGEVPDVAVRALYAGCDIALLRGDITVQKACLKRLDAALAAGEIPAAEVKQKQERIAMLKKHYVKQRPQDLNVIGCKEHRELCKRIEAHDPLQGGAKLRIRKSMSF